MEKESGEKNLRECHRQDGGRSEMRAQARFKGKVSSYFLGLMLIISPLFQFQYRNINFYNKFTL